MLQTDEEVERLAREQFGLVRPGELAYVVVGSSVEATTTTAPPAATLDDPGERPWWRDVWEFLTGGDLVHDG